VARLLTLSFGAAAGVSAVATGAAAGKAVIAERRDASGGTGGAGSAWGGITIIGGGA
jgi:hypothetical protein